MRRTGRRKLARQATWYPISVNVEGTEVTGEFSVDRKDWMTVRMHGGGEKGAQGGPAAASVAKMVLMELFLEAPRSKMTRSAQ